MGIIFDTSVIIGIERGHKSLDALIAGREEDPFGISVVTATEASANRKAACEGGLSKY